MHLFAATQVQNRLFHIHTQRPLKTVSSLNNMKYMTFDITASTPHCLIYSHELIAITVALKDRLQSFVNKEI